MYILVAILHCTYPTICIDDNYVTIMKIEESRPTDACHENSITQDIVFNMCTIVRLKPQLLC